MRSTGRESPGTLELLVPRLLPQPKARLDIIPSKYCVKWNKSGSCSNHQCKFKHEKRPIGVHQEQVNGVDLLLGMTSVKVRRSASFGSRGDVIGETNANSKLKGSLIAPPGRRRQHHPELRPGKGRKELSPHLGPAAYCDWMGWL